MPVAARFRWVKCSRIPNPPPALSSPSALPLSNSSPHAGGPNAAVPLPPASPPIDALPSLELVLLSRMPTLQHVPKAVRDSWALLLCEVLSDITTCPSEVGHWCKLFMLPKCVLMNPPRGGRSHCRDTLKLVLARIQKWKGGGIMDLWSKATETVVPDLKQRQLHPSLFAVATPQEPAGQLQMANTRSPFSASLPWALPLPPARSLMRC